MSREGDKLPHPTNVGGLTEDQHRKMFKAMGECFAVCELVRDDQGKAVDFLSTGVDTDVIPIHDERMLEACTRVVERGEPTRLEQYIESHGRWLCIKIYHVGADHFTLIFNDITERKRKNDELVFQAKLLDNVHDAIVATDGDLNVTYWNKAAEAMLGWTEAEALGLPPQEILKRVVSKPSLEEALNKLREGKDLDLEIALKHRSGHTVFSHTRTTALLDPDGDLIGTVSAIRDVTEYKNVEEALRRSNAELQQFAYVASHDLQEPLRMVTSYIGLLNKKFGDELNPQAKEYMSFAVEGSVRMKVLINDLLTYSRIDSRPIVRENIDMNAVARTVTEDLHIAIRDSRAEVIVNSLPTVCADGTQMKQLLTNLISNAVKFHADRSPRVEVSAIICDNDIVFTVQDNGIGIDPRFEDKLFKMFSRLHTRDEYPGTGIGLAISKKIVERYGGRIWFESELGKGTTIFFTLPAHSNA
jgi:PAS domain S-box-containing protein